MQIKLKPVINLTDEEKHFLAEAAGLCVNRNDCNSCPIHDICFDCFAENVSLSDFITEIINASE